MGVDLFLRRESASWRTGPNSRQAGDWNEVVLVISRSPMGTAISFALPAQRFGSFRSPEGGLSFIDLNERHVDSTCLGRVVSDSFPTTITASSTWRYGDDATTAGRPHRVGASTLLKTTTSDSRRPPNHVYSPRKTTSQDQRDRDRIKFVYETWL